MLKGLFTTWTILLLLAVTTGCTSTHTPADSLMSELRKTIHDRDIYQAKKENRLEELRQALYSATDDKSRFIALGDLLDEFRPYNTDSAFAYCKKREILAMETGNPEFITNARLNTANVLGSIGMYKEALDIMDSIPYDSVPEYLRPYYFYINRTVASYISGLFRQERRQRQISADIRDISGLITIAVSSRIIVIRNRSV